jgi:uncharacterized membrane protein YtjA (UPF0391 family)
MLWAECRHDQEANILSWPLVFLVLAQFAGVLGATEQIGIASEVGWALFGLGLVAALVSLELGLRAPPR